MREEDLLDMATIHANALRGLVPVSDIARYRIPPVTATIEVEIPYTLVRLTVYELDVSRAEERRAEIQQWVESIPFSARLRFGEGVEVE